jgi:Skp family chaperone for outer membrane proteins
MRTSLAGCALGLLGLGVVASQETGVAAARIAFVDLQSALEGSQKAKDRQEKLRRDLAPQLGEFNRIKADLERRDRELQALDPSTLTYHEARLDLATAAMRFEENQKRFLRDSERKKEEILVEAYREIRAAVAEIAAARGLAAVFSLDEEEAAREGGEAAPSLQLIRRRNVHYFDPSLDVTAEVVRLLNR